MNTELSFAPLRRFHVDPVIAVVAGLLLLLGLLMMTSASVSTADNNFSDPLYYFKRQSVFMILGFVGTALVLTIPLRWWNWSGYLALLMAFVLLTLVLVPGLGHEVNGSTRWIRMGVMNFQVSEAARLLILVYVCSYLVRHQQEVREHFAGFAKPMLFVVVASCLLLLEPDFGAATVLLGMTLGVLFVGGVRFRHYLLMVVLAIGAMGGMAMSNKERMERLTLFLDPWQDPFGGGFQLTQSLIAIGRGEWFGVGLGASVQKMFYLPEAHTDFVFAVLAEELGLIGAALTIALYFVLVVRGFAIARRALRADLFFAAYLAFGLSIWFGLQSFINIGVNMGVLPTKGLTLPLMSYGGSSLLIAMASVGLLLRVGHEVVCAENHVNTRVARKVPARVAARRTRVAA